MLTEAEEASIQSDAYIDALLNGHARAPIRIPRPDHAPEPNVRHVIRVLERGLPRFHPSFLFEERLAQELRAAAGGEHETQVALDRRVVIGGAIASSVAGAAVLAWRRRRV
jgi:hypothetical protein